MRQKMYLPTIISSNGKHFTTLAEVDKGRAEKSLKIAIGNFVKYHKNETIVRAYLATYFREV